MKRLFLLFFLTSFCYAQDRVDVLLDSLTLVKDTGKELLISLEIADELKESDWERALHYIEYAEELADKSDSDKDFSDYYRKTAEIYYKKDALDVALEYYLRAYDYYENKDETFEKYTLENSLAILYGRIDKREKALPFFRRIYKYAKKENDSFLLAKTLNNLGTIYINEDVDSAMYYYNRSLEIVKNSDENNPLKAFLYANLGRGYFMKDSIELARQKFDLAKKFIENDGDARQKGWVYNSISRFYFYTNQADSAIVYAKKANDALKEIPYSFENQDAVNLLYKAYVLNEDYKNAATYFQVYDDIRDSLNIEEKAVNIEKLKLAQEYKTKDEIRQLKESKQRFKFYLLGLGLIILLLILAILLNRYRNRLQKTRLEKDLLFSKRKELDANLELKNKELISKAMMEIHRAEIIQEILNDLKHIKLKAIKKETQQAIDFILKRLEKETSASSNMWEEFEVSFEQVHESFYKKLLSKHPDLTSRDLRLAALLKLNLSTKEIAQLTGQSFKSVENARTRLRKKLDLTNTTTDLVQYLFKF